MYDINHDKSARETVMTLTGSNNKKGSISKGKIIARLYWYIYKPRNISYIVSCLLILISRQLSIYIKHTTKNHEPIIIIPYSLQIRSTVYIYVEQMLPNSAKCAARNLAKKKIKKRDEESPHYIHAAFV